MHDILVLRTIVLVQYHMQAQETEPGGMWILECLGPLTKSPSMFKKVMPVLPAFVSAFLFVISFRGIFLLICSLFEKKRIF